MALKIRKRSDWCWEIPRQGAMRTFGLVYASAALMASIRQDEALQQVANVATLPGIVGPAIAMPDIHWGYGFPIGGVAAFDRDEGVVSPGGVGYDINCGVRLLRTDLEAGSIEPLADRIADRLYQAVPSGVGSTRKQLRLNHQELKRVLVDGAAWAVRQGFGKTQDLERIEDGGKLAGAEPDLLSERALERGRDQLGTLGSGNHFLELQRVDEIFDEAAAVRLGLFVGQLVVSIHTGSRGLGYQVCDDQVRIMQKTVQRYGISLPDRQLCCAPLTSPEGHDYLAAMAAAANFAFANRQIISSEVRRVLAETLGRSETALGLNTVWDVCHNIAKWEEHEVEGRRRRLCVHRKGATRAFAPGHPALPASLRDMGQPVLVPGDMGRCSYVMLGTEDAMRNSYGSCSHGAGRLLSRHAAKKAARGRDIFGDLKAQGIRLRAAGRGTVAEEIPEAYKDVTEVVSVAEQAGLGRLLARLKPLVVVKG
ncbi:MAG: RNA ligase RtcB [Geothermobacteraceae bacterium]